jgi:hypothetical protein
MNARSDLTHQRRTYAMVRLQLAMSRFVNAGSNLERAQARRWVNAWSSAIGARRLRYRLDNPR